VVDLSPEVVRDAVDLHEDLIQIPSPVGQGPHVIDPLSLDLGGEQRAKSVPPEPHGLVADVDAALMQQVLDVAERQRVADVPRHCQADDLWAGLDVPEGGMLGQLTRLGGSPILRDEIALTAPSADTSITSPRVACATRSSPSSPSPRSSCVQRKTHGKEPAHPSRGGLFAVSE
jgi:hypothetical protein